MNSPLVDVLTNAVVPLVAFLATLVGYVLLSLNGNGAAADTLKDFMWVEVGTVAGVSIPVKR